MKPQNPTINQTSADGLYKLQTDQLSCCCGRLLFKVTSAGIGIKCPRCRRVLHVPRPVLLAAYKNLEVRDPLSPEPVTKDSHHLGVIKANKKTK